MSLVLVFLSLPEEALSHIFEMWELLWVCLVFFSFSSFPEWISFQFSFYCLKVFIGFTVLVSFLFVFKLSLYGGNM